MDRVYKEDIPAKRKELEKLRQGFSGLPSKTDWNRLRVEPLLAHAKSLERLLQSRRFSRETSRLPRGVVMFHSDLVYLRENVKALKAIFESERKAQTKSPRASRRRPQRPLPERNRG